MENFKPIIIDVKYVDNQPIETPQKTPQPFNPLKHGKMLFGFGLIALTLILLSITTSTAFNPLSDGGFWVTHIGVLVFWAVAIFSKKVETLTFPTRLNYTLLWLVLLQIGCFMLNIELRFFPPSATWLQVVLSLSVISLIALTFKDLLPDNALKALYFLLGVGFVMDVYFMAILLPIPPFSLMSLVFFGLSFYAFGPLLKIIYIATFLYKNHDFMPKITRFFGFGAAFSGVMGGIFLLLWTSMVNKADAAFGDTKNPLPAWVRVAQVLPPSVLTEKILKSNQSGRFGRGFGDFSTNNDRQHDPLVALANALKPLPDLDQADRANALRSIFDAKNASEQRLWTGDNLRLATVETAIEVHSAQRLAYTEQVLRIENTDKHAGSWSTNEAILTFRLPEGGVVSSLSLWVNGVERAGLLTTQEKAATAYQSIVGYERRDPSVIHWREGNSVSVRVFPCTPTEMRQVKIGFTTPLEVSAGQLFYHLPTLEGLPIHSTKHTVSLTGVEAFESRATFQKKDKKHSLSTIYDADLAFSMPLLPLAESSFSFQNKTYRMHEMSVLGSRYVPFEPSEIYLDINAAWSSEVDKIWDLVKNKPVFVFIDGQMTALTADNHATIFKQLGKNNFSLFPFHNVKNPENALVISMNNKPFMPDFTVLKGSRFADEMAEKLPKMPQIRTFTLGSTIYLDALRQMRVTLNDKGNVADLSKILTEHIFLKNPESANEWVIAPSNILISEEKNDGKTIANAPDHVFRLFAYNKVLAAVGRHFYEKTKVQTTVESQENERQNATENVNVNENENASKDWKILEKMPNSTENQDDFDIKDALKLAEKAHIVTPLSSLIVLETQADYDRFNIHQSKNALGNAALSNAGAAPEPHEWLLIILAFGVVLWTVRQRFRV